MIAITAGKIAEIVNGHLYGDSTVVVSEVPVLDSRKCVDGSLFLAFKGENLDGHDFAADAISRGASLVLSSRKLEVPCVVVPDVAVAIARLAHFVRESLPDLIVIGITGSQGKTTTKDLVAAILGLVGKTIATDKSRNNELGLPITLMECDESTKYCVLEMGARHMGDIALLCKIAEPDVGVVLNVGSAHLGEFGSRELIAKTKSELVQNLKPNGIAILGRYDSFTLDMAKGLKNRVLTFGQNSEAQIRATEIEIREGRAHFDLVTPSGREAVALRLVGEHQIPNALAAAAVCTALDISVETIATGLSTADMPSKLRMEIIELSDLLVINDSYNASPESTIAALKSLSLFAQERGGESWAFLGKMHELGESSAQAHSRVGTEAGQLGIDHLICVDAPEYALALEGYPDMKVHKCPTKSSTHVIWQHISPGDVVLIKGSRAEKMEELCEQLLQWWRQKAGEEE